MMVLAATREAPIAFPRASVETVWGGPFILLLLSLFLLLLSSLLRNQDPQGDGWRQKSSR